MKHLWLTHLRLCEFWSQKPSCTSDDFSGDNAVRDGKRDVFSLKMFVFICCSVSKTHFDSVLWDNEQKGCVTLHKQCTCHLFEHWVWNIMQFRRIFLFYFNKHEEQCWKQKETTALETVSLSHEFVSVCICHSCSLVITHTSGNEAYEKDAAQNAACTDYKKIGRGFLGHEQMNGVVCDIWGCCGVIVKLRRPNVHPEFLPQERH